MPFLLLFCAVLFWSGHNVVAKSIIPFIPPFSFTFVRWLIAAVIILPFCWPYIRKDWQLALKAWKRLFVITATGICAFNAFMYIALQTTTAINIGLISSIFPVTIALLSLIILKIRLNPIQMVGMTVCFAGVIIVILRGEITTMTDLVFVEGDLWMLVGVFCGALYPVLLHDKPDIHPFSLLSILIILGAILSLPLFLIDIFQGKTIQGSQNVYLGLVFIGLFPSLLSYLCWNRGIEMIGANRAGLFLNLVPILTAVMAYMFIDEIISWYHFTGLALVIVGMLMFNVKNSRKHDDEKIAHVE
jgi:drug/metabolite transporter (DMT)-like permease